MSTSATEESSPTKGDKPVFTDKEERVLKAAWSCLKAPPEIDIEKLKIAAEFNTIKTASNTWGVIKKKLAALAPPPADEDDDNTLATPKAKSTPKKRAKKAAAAEGEGEDQDFESPTKKRKSRKAVKAGGDGSTTTEVVKTEEVEDDAEN